MDDLLYICRNLDIDKYDLYKYMLNRIGYYAFNLGEYDIAKKMWLMAIEKGNDQAMCNLGSYYKNIEQNYDKMKKYYLMAIVKGNDQAMCNLGSYYKNIEHNYEEMKKYYLMAIEKGNDLAMSNLGLYYQQIEHKYDEMKKYYLMAIEKDNNQAMCNLGLYYQQIEPKYDEMKKYYLMAIEKGNDLAMSNLGLYYKQIEHNYDEMKKYYLMAIENGNERTMYMLCKHYTVHNDFDSIMTVLRMDICKHNKFINTYKRFEQLYIKHKILTNNLLQAIITKITVDEPLICLICYSVYKTVVNFNCNKNINMKHIFCVNCINEWYSIHDLTCVLCTISLNIDNFIIIEAK